jgi:uncharacterized membrane protein YgdD (TMEM256/DUF423 family)
MKEGLITGAALIGTSIILGAFAAHGLEKHLESGLMTERMMRNFETGARYQMYAGIGILLMAALQGIYPDWNISAWTFRLLLIGAILFCGSLYLLSTRDVIGLQSWKWLGPITPLGGLCMIAGWVVLMVQIIKAK